MINADCYRRASNTLYAVTTTSSCLTADDELNVSVCVCVYRTLNLIEFPLDWEHRDNTSKILSRLGNPFNFYLLKQQKYFRARDKLRLDHVFVVVTFSHLKI